MTGILDATITQLRAHCPFFQNRVAGAADFRKGLQEYNATMRLPAAYVVPLAQEAGPNSQMVGLQQIIEKEVGVIVELDATPDRRGQDPAMTYDDIEAALFSTLINWAPAECRVPNRQGYQFATGMFLDLDRARLFYQWAFRLPYMITDEDGWHEPDLGELKAIELDIYHKEGAAPVDPDVDVPAAVAIIATNPPMEPIGPPPWPDGWPVMPDEWRDE